MDIKDNLDIETIAKDSSLIKDASLIDLANRTFETLKNWNNWTDPDDHFMKYRGSQLQRRKAFFVEDDDDPPNQLRKYTYPGNQYHLSYLKLTGFQWESLLHYSSISSCPAIQECVELLKKMGLGEFNHVIATYYIDEKANIGWHQDKIADITEGTNIPILSMGETRDLSLKNLQTNVVQHIELSHGDLFVLGWETNLNYEHAILPCKEDKKERISLVFRNIKTVVSRSDVIKKVKT